MSLMDVKVGRMTIGVGGAAQPWPVAFVDPAPAIARRLELAADPRVRGGDPRRTGAAVCAEPRPSLQKALLRYGLKFTPMAAISLAPA